MLRWLRPDDPFPPVAEALARPNGLLAAGGDLTPERIVSAYRLGIFPWYSAADPVLWWSPDPRMVLVPSELKITRSLAKTVKRGGYEMRADASFLAVMRACAEPRPNQDGTWISPEMIEVYGALHDLGYAHSIETWIGGELAGGLYGVALGRVFFGESMFARVSNASKIALVHLARQLDRWNFSMIDCQVRTEHLASLGAREIKRDEFIRALTKLVNYPNCLRRWTLDDDLPQ